MIAGTLFSIIAILLSFISWYDLGLEDLNTRAVILVCTPVATLLLSAIYILFLKKNHIIWEKGSGKIVVCYADIIKKAFPRKNHKKRIVVIPVNTCFDTIVDDDIALIDNPLVSPKSLHGQWVTNLLKAGKKRESLDEDISSSISRKDNSPKSEILQKSRGKRICYERGTVVALNGENNVTFWLLALTKFDNKNNAQCSRNEFIDCIKKLIECYDTNGQGFEMYVPLMGTSLSRVGLSHSEAVQTIVALFKLYSEHLHGRVNIVVYNKEKNKVSIFNA